MQWRGISSSLPKFRKKTFLGKFKTTKGAGDVHRTNPGPQITLVLLPAPVPDTWLTQHPGGYKATLKHLQSTTQTNASSFFLAQHSHNPARNSGRSQTDQESGNALVCLSWLLEPGHFQGWPSRCAPCSKSINNSLAKYKIRNCSELTCMCSSPLREHMVLPSGLSHHYSACEIPLEIRGSEMVTNTCGISKDHWKAEAKAGKAFLFKSHTEKMILWFA